MRYLKPQIGLKHYRASRVCLYFFIALLLLFLLFTLFLTWYVGYYQQFVYLARSFMAGKPYFLTEPGDSWVDVIDYHGKYYWHLGPAPAVILMPFVLLFDRVGVFFRQGYLQIPFTISVFWMCYQLARKYKYCREDAWYLAFAFCFTSPYIPVAFLHWSWFFSQGVVVFFLFLAIYEWHGKKRFWLIGLFYSIILATRYTAALTILFFIGDIFWSSTATYRNRFKQLSLLMIPVLFVGSLLLWYNYVRFGNGLDSGYMKAGNMSIHVYYRFEQLKYGLFQLRNVPTNIYYYFIKTVDPVLVEQYNGNVHTYVLKFPYITLKNPGLNFFASSPIFLFIFYAFRHRIRTRVVWLSLVAVAAVFPLLLMYYWPGMTQLGPRYMLDFLPFLYLILLQSFEKYRLPIGCKILILASALTDFLLFIAVMSYP